MIFIRSPNLISDDICINFFQRDHKFDLLSVVLQNNSLNTNSHLVNANVARCLANLSANGFATIEKTNRLHFNAVLVFFFFFVQFKIIVENFQLLIVEKDWLQPILGWIRLNVDENLDLACLTTLANLASNRAICLVIFATIQTIYPTKEVRLSLENLLEIFCNRLVSNLNVLVCSRFELYDRFI